jgi:NADPH2:quinone reductase
MKAMVINQFGDASVFEQVEMSTPAIQAHQVLVQVQASSVNPLDYKIRNGMLGMLGPAFPAVLHGDMAGIVTEVGANVTKFKVGDAVYGCVGGVTNLPGVLAEYIAADADLLAHKPKNVTMAEAAALPLVSLTAWEALIRLANIQPKQKVLVHAGSGGVGHIAIQLAKWRQADVYTTCSNAEKMALARELGADHVINYRQQSVSEYVAQYTHGAGFEVVLDTLGGEVLDTSFAAVAMNGQVISIAAFGAHNLMPLSVKGASLHTVFQPNPLLTGLGREHYGQILAEITRLVESKTIKPLLDQQQFTFSAASQAHAHLESGNAIGKVVLTNNW